MIFHFFEINVASIMMAVDSKMATVAVVVMNQDMNDHSPPLFQHIPISSITFSGVVVH
jgi:hypothetical protein